MVGNLKLWGVNACHNKCFFCRYCHFQEYKLAIFHTRGGGLQENVAFWWVLHFVQYLIVEQTQVLLCVLAWCASHVVFVATLWKKIAKTFKNPIAKTTFVCYTFGVASGIVVIHQTLYPSRKFLLAKEDYMNNIEDFTIDANGILTKYTGSQAEVVISEGVNKIAKDAFCNCKTITSVIIPHGVTEIGDFAFSFCEALQSVTIPNTVTTIGEYAFWDCTKIEHISIPHGVTEIGKSAFSGCSGLKSIDIPDSVHSLGREAFENCKGFTSFSIPQGISQILWGTFAGCKGLTAITIPEHIREIKDGAFERCIGLTDFTVLGSKTSIDKGAFYKCSPTLRFHTPENSSAERFAHNYVCYKWWSDDDYNPH